MSTDMVPDAYWNWALENPCQVRGCGKPDSEKPMAYRGEPYCCDLHRKELGLKKEIDVTHGRSA